MELCAERALNYIVKRRGKHSNVESFISGELK